MAEVETTDERYSAIPEGIREIYASLENELVWLHGKWNMYRQLFGTNEHRIDLLNDSAPTFFGHLHWIWLDGIVIEICRLTEKPELGGHDNLVIGQLYERLDKEQFSNLADKLQNQLRDVKRSCQHLRVRRNRGIAHLDLKTALATTETALPGISRDDVERALAAVRDFLNTVRLQFLDSKMGFEAFHMRDDANALIHNLKRAAAYRDLEEDDYQYRNCLLEGPYRDA